MKRNNRGQNSIFLKELMKRRVTIYLKTRPHIASSGIAFEGA